MAKRNKLVSYSKRFDFFKTNIEFRENGGDSFGSVFGTCMSFMIALIVRSEWYASLFLQF